METLGTALQAVVMSLDVLLKQSIGVDAVAFHCVCVLRLAVVGAQGGFGDVPCEPEALGVVEANIVLGDFLELAPVRVLGASECVRTADGRVGAPVDKGCMG